VEYLQLIRCQNSVIMARAAAPAAQPHLPGSPGEHGLTRQGLLTYT
jgi:hypothetical protein